MGGIIEIQDGAVWRPLETANETPMTGCRVGEKTGLLAAAWLALHIDDGSDYVQANRMQVITPYYISRSDDPVLLLTRDGVLVEHLWYWGNRLWPTY